VAYTRDFHFAFANCSENVCYLFGFLAMPNKVDVVPWVLADTQVQPQLVDVMAGEAGGPA